MALFWTACVGYAAAHLSHGWIPHDAGALAESAERVLGGQLPHRDFDEIYTGGLSYLHAVAFRLVGPSLLAMRIPLLAVFSLWLVTVYAIARRAATLPLAIAAMLLATAWGIPVYPEAMPSWYNLFFATFGVYALSRFVDEPRRRWLFLAGICAGASCLVKITGLYSAAAGLLFLAYHQQQRARASGDGVAGERSGSVAFTLLIVAFNALLLALVRHALEPNVILQFLLPGASISALLVWREWRAPAPPSRKWLAANFRLAVPFAVGLGLPIAIWLVPYVVSGSLDALVNGIFVLPLLRLRFATMAPVGGLGFVLLVAEGALAARLGRALGSVARMRAEFVVVTVFFVIAIGAALPRLYLVAWAPMRVLIPLGVVWATYHLAQRERDHRTDACDERIFLLAVATAMCGLVQFPFAGDVYFFYVGPLAALVIVALAGTGTPRMRRITCAGVLAYTLFMSLVIRHSWHNQERAPLPMARGGVLVSRQDSATYGAIVRALRGHSRSTYTYASPDCPQVYFLSGLRNPTRTLFDFFDDSVGRTPRILNALAAHGVTAIAVNDRPEFSGPMPGDLQAALASRYPFAEHIGNFTVRWRQ